MIRFPKHLTKCLAEYQAVCFFLLVEILVLYCRSFLRVSKTAFLDLNLLTRTRLAKLSAKESSKHMALL